MVPRERFHRDIRQFCSRRDLPPPSSYRDFRRDFCGDESNLRICPNFLSDLTRAKFNGEVKVEKKYRLRLKILLGGKVLEKKANGLSEIPKKARLCEIDEDLHPFKKKIRFINSKSRPLPLPLQEVEEGEIVEGCWMNMPPLEVTREKGEILEKTVVVKEEATIQTRKPRIRFHCRTAAAANSQEIDPFQKINSLSEYELVRKINEGTFGVVHEAIHKKSGQVVALKQMKNEDGETGLSPEAFIEIKLLFSLSHQSILKVIEVVRDKNSGDFYLAMEFMEQDLYQLLRQQSLSTSEVKGLMLQLLEGVSFLHRNDILHRDLKTSNLLLNKNGKLNICDFGLACREKRDGSPLESLVVTLWYRAPELILGSTQYSKEIDMWSVGCIMGELLKRDPIFKGNTEMEQLHCIAQVLGNPTSKNSPGLSSLPGFSNVKFAHQPENLLSQKFPVLSNLGLDLLKRLLSYDPKKRITAEAAKKHRWFQEFPLPKPLKM